MEAIIYSTISVVLLIIGVVLAVAFFISEIYFKKMRHEDLYLNN